MSKVAVVYWSSTGNTEAMANAVAEGAKMAGADTEIFTASDFDSGKAAAFDAIAFGCPAMAAGAKLLLFDEPTSGLDFSHMEKVAVLLRELSNAGNTVLVSTHDSELIDMCCDYELCIEKGRVAYLLKRGN